MKKIFSVLIIFLVIWAAASPQSKTRLIPEAPEGHFEMGREYISLSNNQIQVELGFDGIFEGFLVFDAVVYNQSGESLALDPSDFYYILLDNPEANSSVLPPFAAVNPERILRQYNHIHVAKAKGKGTNTVFGFMETGAGFLGHLSAFLATENPAYVVDAVFSGIGTAGHYAAQGRQIGSEMDQIAMEMEVVREEILRKGEIPSGKVQSGYLFFPEFEDNGYIMICIPLEDQVFQFVYNKTREQE